MTTREIEYEEQLNRIKEKMFLVKHVILVMSGKGGGEKAAHELGVSFLGRVPLQPEFVDYGDKGTPFVSFQQGSKSAEAFKNIVNTITTWVNNK